ncbi:MAG: ester cyclase [Flavisolibacter sp.]
MRNVQSTLLYQWFNEVWNNSNENAIDRLMAHDSTAHGIIEPGQPIGPEGFKRFYNDFRKQFKDINIEVDDVITEDDMEIARTTVSAVHVESNKKVNFSGMCMARISDGKIAEAWNNYDFLGMHQQIGHTLTS